MLLASIARFARSYELKVEDSFSPPWICKLGRELEPARAPTRYRFLTKLSHYIRSGVRLSSRLTTAICRRVYR